jgi:hypothetical protein
MLCGASVDDDPPVKSMVSDAASIVAALDEGGLE